MGTDRPTGRHSSEGAEIEVTPEMIATGVSAWREWVGSGADEFSTAGSPSDQALEALSASVFLSMAAISPVFSKKAFSPSLMSERSSAAANISSTV